MYIVVHLLSLYLLFDFDISAFKFIKNFCVCVCVCFFLNFFFF